MDFLMNHLNGMLQPLLKRNSISLIESMINRTFDSEYYYNALSGYSYLRKLIPSYSGNSFRVRRASDNQELDIGFIDQGLMGGPSDYDSAVDFCAGTDGFIVTEYDQIGSCDATQSDPTKQKICVEAGVLVTSLKGVFEPRIDGVNDSIYALLPNETTLQVAYGSYSACQALEITTEPSGITYLPYGDSGQHSLSYSELVYFNSIPSTAYINDLISRCMP